MRSARLLALITVLALAPGLLSACTSPSSNQDGASMSRVQHYASLDELSDASAVVVVGSVVDQTVARDIDELTEFTISTVQIDEVVKSDGTHQAGDTIQVRQLGGGEQAAPTPVLSTESKYLLYLTPSGLAAPLDSQFYVTGANAGVYASAGASARGTEVTSEFLQVDAEPGEQLPSVIEVDDALRAAQ
mgnify:CR=1 FL=1